MNIKRFLILLVMSCFLVIGVNCKEKSEYDKYGYYKETNTSYISNQDDGAKVKNVIIILGDGMGENQVKVTEKYGLEEGQKLDLAKAEHKGYIDTNCLDNVVTDSAASATAIATGVRTLYKRVGMDEEGNELKTILDYAKESGKKTGLITTDVLDGATPLAFSSHGKNRYLNTDKMILEQIYSEIDILMGWGEASYYEHKALIESLGYEYANDKKSVMNSKSDKIFSSFSTSSKVADKMPTLPEMTKKSIDVLSKNEEGFVLVIEEALIDKKCDAGLIDEMMDAVINLDKTLRVCLNFMRSNDDTLVIVVADHETGGLVMGEGNPDVNWFTEPTRYHTNVKVPLYAYGTRSNVFNNCDILNKDIFYILKDLLKI